MWFDNYNLKCKFMYLFHDLRWHPGALLTFKLLARQPIGDYPSNRKVANLLFHSQTPTWFDNLRYKSTYLFHDLRCHPARRANERVSDIITGRVFAGRQPGADTKVRDHHAAIFTEQYVSGLNVPVKHIIHNELIHLVNSSTRWLKATAMGDEDPPYGPQALNFLPNSNALIYVVVLLLHVDAMMHDFDSRCNFQCEVCWFHCNFDTLNCFLP